MNKIEQMIEELCPEGVEFVKLGDVCEIRGRIGFRGYTRNDLVKEGEGPITLSPSNIIDNRISYDNSSYISWNKYYESPEIIVENDDIIFTKTASVGKTALIKNLPQKATINPQLVLLKNISCNHSYLAYILQDNKFQNEVKKKTGKGSVPNVPQSSLASIEIPLPPLPIQEEIVRILDKFTTLEAELEAELDCRKRQYEYYRDKLLSFNRIGGGTGEVIWKKMSEVGTFIRGKRFVRTDIVEEGIPCIHYGDMYTYYGHKTTKARTYLTKEKAKNMRFAQKNDVIIVGAGENNIDIGVGLAWLGEEDVAVHDACYIFKSDLEPRYVSHYLRSTEYHWQILKYVSDGKICSISAKGIGESIIPIPPLSEQQRIADILDRFESLTTSISEGLPAEIAARHQQYEYYRDKLLTFKKKTA